MGLTNAAARVAPEKTAFRPVLPPHLLAGLQPEKMMATYAQKLKDPRWQRMRLEKLEEARWECGECGEKAKTLHVHHRIYRKGREPWEYEFRELQVLCEDCHEAHHNDERTMNEILAHVQYTEALSVLGGYFDHDEEVDQGYLEMARQTYPLGYAAGFTAQLMGHLDIDDMYKVAQYAVSLTGPNSEARPKLRRGLHIFGKENV